MNPCHLFNLAAVKAMAARMAPHIQLTLAAIIYLMLAEAFLVSAWFAVSVVIFFFKHFFN